METIMHTVSILMIRKWGGIFLGATHLSRAAIGRLLRASVFVGAACSFITGVEGADISSKEMSVSPQSTLSSSITCCIFSPPLLNAGGREAAGAGDAVTMRTGATSSTVSVSEVCNDEVINLRTY